MRHEHFIFIIIITTATTTTTQPSSSTTTTTKPTTTTTTTTTTKPTTTQQTTTAATTTTKPTTTTTTTQQTTTKPTTTQEQLTAYRIAKYKEILDKETIYFEISSNYSETEMIPVTFARKNGNMYMATNAEGIEMRVYYEKKTNKMWAYANIAVWWYYEVPANEMADMNMTEMLEEIRIKNVGEISVIRTTFNGKSVIRESYYDKTTGYTMFTPACRRKFSTSGTASMLHELQNTDQENSQARTWCVGSTSST